MKRFAILALTIVFGAFGMAQEKRLLKPETPVTLQDGQYARNLTGGQLWNELKQYEAEKKATSGARLEQNRSGKVFVVPMPYAAQENLRMQQETFDKLATTSVAAEPVRGARDHTMEVGYNQQWGNTGTFAAYVDALAKIYGSKETRTLHAHLNAGGHVFNYQVKAVEFSAEMRNDNGNPSAHTVLRLFGQTKFSYSGTTVYTHQFFNGQASKEAQFFIGPVPISVRGTIGGQAGFDARLTVVGTGIQGSVTPAITSYAKADAGIDLWFVKAGVEGSLELLNDNLPASVTVQLLQENGFTLDIALKVDNHLSALKGQVTLFAEVYELWEDSWQRYSTTLFAWNGIQKDWTLYNQSLKLPLN